MSIREEIKKYFQDIIYSPSGLRKRINNAPREYIEYCENILKETPEWLKLSYIILGICKDVELGYCKTCGKRLTYLQMRKDGYCSRRCVVTNEKIRKDISEKQIKTNLEKYGCVNPMQSNIVKNKVKETCIEKYGTTSFLASEEAREKIKDTNIKKYGVENVFGAKEIRDKIKDTNKERYGNEIYTNTKDFKEKCLNTFNTKYNINSPFESKLIQEKAKNTIKEKYGYYNIFLVKENIEKCRAIQKDKSWNVILEWKDFIIPLFSKDEYEGHTNKEYNWICKKCGNTFSQKIYTTHFNKEYACLPRCLKCYPFHVGISFKEKEVTTFCKQYYPNLIENNREIIKPLEVDILIPNIKLAIEFNGVYWHSIEAAVPNNYHLNKLERCEAIGYHLVQIWEDEWENNRDEVKRKLLKIFNNEEEVFIDKEIKLDREWYQKKEISGYKLVNIVAPEIVKRDNCNCENSGYLIYEKI